MKHKIHIRGLILATLFVFAVQFVFASFTLSGNTSSDRRNSSKYSLKNLSKYSGKSSLSVGSIRYNTKLTATELDGKNSSVQSSNGNTTFIYPYKIKVKVPKFKPPTKPSF